MIAQDRAWTLKIDHAIENRADITGVNSVLTTGIYFEPKIFAFITITYIIIKCSFQNNIK